MRGAPQAGSASAAAISRTRDAAATRFERESPEPSARVSFAVRMPFCCSSEWVRATPAAVVPVPTP